jgi:ubiquinone/menaquinone biosynthesis C-methylase UbiE
MDTIKQALGRFPGGRVLDVATGEGEFIKTLASGLKGYVEIVGIDTFMYTKTAGGTFYAGHVHFVQMDARHLGFGDECFDTVSISSSLHHLDDIPQCIGEMKRVLKPGGHLIIRETHRDVQAEPQRTDMAIHHWVAALDSAFGYTHNRTFTRQELVELAESLGLCELVFHDIVHTNMNPMDEAAIKESEEVIDRYILHAEGLPDHRRFVQQGEELRRRLHRVGVQWEPELIVVGEKPG